MVSKAPREHSIARRLRHLVANEKQGAIVRLSSNKIDRRSPLLVALIVTVLSAAPPRAETLIEGDSSGVRVKAQDATLQEVLTALGTSFGVQYRTSSDLGRPITGTYTGRLRDVVVRLLDGYDYVLRNSDNHLDIVVVDTAGSQPVIATSVRHAANPDR